jgi:hypothetical protein
VAQEGRVELKYSGFRFEASVQALRRIPHTSFDAYFSGRYAQDVCRDGSIFVDRDSEHFGHILEYMRDGVAAVAEPDARPSVSLLRALKREFGYYCIDLSTSDATESAQPEVAFAIDGGDVGRQLGSSMERYDLASGQLIQVAPMGTSRESFGACMVAGELYVSGGKNALSKRHMSSVEKNSPSTDTWSAMAPMPAARSSHAAVAVGITMYVRAACLMAKKR